MMMMKVNGRNVSLTNHEDTANRLNTALYWANGADTLDTLYDLLLDFENGTGTLNAVQRFLESISDLTVLEVMAYLNHEQKAIA